MQQGVVEKSGAWYSYNGERIGQGKKNSAAWLDENDDLRAEIEGRIRAALLPGHEPTASETPDADRVCA